MGRISRISKIKGDKGTKDINVIFDSGATRSVIRKDVAEKFCNIIYFNNPFLNGFIDNVKNPVGLFGKCMDKWSKITKDFR